MSPPPKKRTAKRCRSCNAPIRFVKLASGRWLPVDAQPSELNGNVIVQRGVARVLGGMDLKGAREEGYDLYVSHFATCPGADQHRRDSRAPDPGQRERAAARRQAQTAFAAAKRKRDPAQGRLL